MGGGNGAKAASKRARQGDKGPAEAKSQLKSNVQAMDIQCVVCKSTFLSTSRAPALVDHAQNKHSKTLDDCFPGFVETEKKDTKVKKEAGKSEVKKGGGK